MTVHGDIFLRPRGTYDCAQTLLYRIATPRAYARLDFIHVLHPSAIEGVLAKGGRAGCIGVIPNGISMERFSAPKIRNADSPVRFLFVGRLAVEKDPEFLLSVLNKLPAEKRNLELLYVGAGPLEERLCKAVRINGLSQQVKFLGSCSPNQVAKIYADADVVCIPSRSDQFPTVALEALASGTPVIGNRIEGLQHVIKDGVTGWLLPQGDVTAWRDAFLNITSDVPALRGMEKDCRDAAWKSYSWESIGFKLASEVEALLKDEKQ
jgi:glycosyltransferase involved in cell wall biosynthesis